MDFCNDIEEEAVFDYHESLNLKVFKIQQASKLFCSKSVNILKIQVYVCVTNVRSIVLHASCSNA